MNGEIYMQGQILGTHSFLLKEEVKGIMGE